VSTTAAPTAEVVAVLQGLDLFEGVDAAVLAPFAAEAVPVTYPAGQELWPQGSPSLFFQVLMTGRVEWSRVLGGERVVLAEHHAVTYFGAISALSQIPAKVSSRAVEECRVLRFPAAALRALCATDEQLLSRVVRLTGEVVSTNEGALRERDRLASIGTLAAGLAHEINNPAAAALRQVAALRDALGTNAVPAPAAPAPAEPLARADREEELAAWLTAAGVLEPWSVAAGLSEAGADLAWCEQVGAEGVGAAAAALSARGLLEELDDALGRIVLLVSTMRDYANLDRTPERDVDVAAGVRAAAVVVGIDVALSVEGLVPAIAAFPGELSQLWTALLRNAAEAGPGAVEVEVRPSRDGVHVALFDRGPGIPDEHLARVWEPFFTTKPGATGLGLDLARRVVEAHRGRILLGERDGGGTVVTVELPS
jgi:signal transduction histidine kinase